MRKISDQTYLLTDQYKDAAKLNARIELHARFSANTYGWMPWVFDQWETQRWPVDCRVLELGCGPGAVWRINKARIQPGWRIMLSDFSIGMAAQTRENLHSIDNLNYEQIDAQNIPYPDGSLDVVIANHMLYHVPDRPRALAEIRRVLKPAGRFYTTTVGSGHMRELKQLVHEFYADNKSRGFGEIEFTLENGSAQLTPFFTQIDLRIYEDALDVTEVEPLVAFIASTVNEAGADPQPVAAFIHSRMAQNQGHILITKSSGMFCCSC